MPLLCLCQYSFHKESLQGPGVCSSMARTRQQFCEIGGFGTWSHFGFGQQEKPSFANYFSKVRRGRGEAERNWAKIESLVLPWRIWPDPRLDQAADQRNPLAWIITHQSFCWFYRHQIPQKWPIQQFQFSLVGLYCQHQEPQNTIMLHPKKKKMALVPSYSHN